MMKAVQPQCSSRDCCATDVLAESGITQPRRRMLSVDRTIMEITISEAITDGDKAHQQGHLPMTFGLPVLALSAVVLWVINCSVRHMGRAILNL
ncbi:hypothetical protein BJX62DRAFT_198549, partial [Aspergillus germanicus]